MKNIFALALLLLAITLLPVYTQTRPSILDIRQIKTSDLSAIDATKVDTDSVYVTRYGTDSYMLYTPEVSSDSVDTHQLIAGSAGRWRLLKPTIQGNTFGTYENACLSWIISGEGNQRPQVIGTSGDGIATYTARDGVGLYIGMYGREPTYVSDGTGVTYTGTTVVRASGIASTGLRVGMIIDTLHTPKYSGTLLSWDSNTLTVDSWWPQSGTGVAGTPSDGTGFEVNRLTKPFAANFVVSTNATYSLGASGIEVNVSEARAGSPDNSYGVDVNGIAGSPQIAFHGRGGFQFNFLSRDPKTIGFYNLSGTHNAGFRDDSNSTTVLYAQGSHQYFLDFRSPSSSSLSLFRTLGANGYTRIGSSGDPHSTLDVQGSFGTGANSVATSTVVTAAVHTYIITSSADTTMTLPSSVGLAGRQYVFRQHPGSTAGTVTLQASGSQAIAGRTTVANTYNLNASGSATIVSDNAGWILTHEF